MLVVLLLLADVLSLPVQQPDLTAPEVRVSIRPSFMDPYQLLRRPSPSTYTCEALVSQADTKVAFLHAKLVVARGAMEKTTALARGYSLEFSVTVKNEREANAVVTVKRGEQIITRQRSTVNLRTDEGVVPVQ